MGKQPNFCLIMIVICLLWPMKVFAVEYEITNVEINAYLKPNGNVLVKERHTTIERNCCHETKYRKRTRAKKKKSRML